MEDDDEVIDLYGNVQNITASYNLVKEKRELEEAKLLISKLEKDALLNEEKVSMNRLQRVNRKYSLKSREGGGGVV